ncbi:carboxylesterase/lipase family protein [Dyella sp.]|jgi:para-nitrobenzyl esterase|uniref:carboxylesterase/lipase family protein n=1 Tax=Dyella sp. TaxID=1869338 RepID=UPI002D76E166|nr:carboxylesterase/lipase family protein [Dyella sp.]HET6432929.1 carboxylesterase/lipase family protein [Dyella sp.]
MSPRFPRYLLTRRAAAALLALGTCGPAIAQHDTPRVEAGGGLLVGKTASVGGVVVQEFLGIPYAAPPVGALRWKPPQPATGWSEPRDARTFGPRCMQLPLFGDMVFRSRGMSEDCLYLNVWAPAAPADGKRPVLVYFYGGGFLAGDGSEPRYDGAAMAASGLVTVTVNYRLGVFGFLATPALMAESPQHASGNYGLLDQVAALRWVRDNIARFGGDPGHITIAGESAGSISVSALMASPLSKQLIAGAIGESGALITPIAPAPRAVAEATGSAFMEKLQVDSLDALRAMPAQALLQATDPKSEPTLRFAPDIDGYFLPDAPEQIYARGEQAQVPLLLGANSQEGFYTAILHDRSPTPANYRDALDTLFGDKAREALRLYPGATAAEVKRSATALAGDLFIAHSTWRWMALHRQTSNQPVYFYYYARPRPPKRDPAPGEQPEPGAVHSGEIEYAMGNLDGNAVYAWSGTDRAVSRTLQGYFAQFVRTGDPNQAGLPAWPPVSDSHGGLLRQTIDQNTHTEVDRGAARQDFLQAFLRDHANPL